MLWDEFCTLLAGLNDKTPLGRVVSIRAERDPEIIRKFSRDERRIRSEWAEWKSRQRASAPKISRESYKAAMEQIQAAFKSMAGGG